MVLVSVVFACLVHQIKKQWLIYFKLDINGKGINQIISVGLLPFICGILTSIRYWQMIYRWYIDQFENRYSGYSWISWLCFLLKEASRVSLVIYPVVSSLGLVINPGFLNFQVTSYIQIYPVSTGSPFSSFEIESPITVKFHHQTWFVNELRLKRQSTMHSFASFCFQPLVYWLLYHYIW